MLIMILIFAWVDLLLFCLKNVCIKLLILICSAPPLVSAFYVVSTVSIDPTGGNENNNEGIVIHVMCVLHSIILQVLRERFCTQDPFFLSCFQFAISAVSLSFLHNISMALGSNSTFMCAYLIVFTFSLRSRISIKVMLTRYPTHQKYQDITCDSYASLP